MSEERYSQLRLLVLSVGLIVLMGGLMIWQGSQPPVTSDQKDVLTVNQVSQKVIEDQAFSLVVPSGEVRVNIPSYAIKTGSTVSLVMTEPNLFQDAAGMEVWSRPFVANLEFIDSDGNRMGNSASKALLEICFKLTTEYWSHYQISPADFQIQSYDETSQPKIWEEVSAYPDKPTQSLCGKISHYSLYSLAMKKLVIPNTGEEGIYNP
jgi:hypothetical protein